MSNDIEARLHAVGLEYTQMNGVIKAISIQILGKNVTDDLIEELVSEGWVYVVESIERFDPLRGTKFTTYIWRALYSRIRRHYIKIIKRDANLMDEFESLESWDEGSIFEANPYSQTPERFCECVESMGMWQQLKQIHGENIRACLRQVPSCAPVSMRKQYSRNRRHHILLMQDTLSKMSKFDRTQNAG